MRRFEKGTATEVTYGNRLEEVPSQVEASYPAGEGKEDHQDREASFREENRDQEGRADELRKLVMSLSRKLRVDNWTYVHRTLEGEGVHRIHREGPWGVRSWVAADQDVEDRNRNLQVEVRCRIRRQP